MPYVNVARNHCPACAAMLMMSSQEVNSDKRLIIRLRNKALILSRDRLQDMETNVKHTFFEMFKKEQINYAMNIFWKNISIYLNFSQPARAVTGRQCPHNGEVEDFLTH